MTPLDRTACSFAASVVLCLSYAGSLYANTDTPPYVPGVFGEVEREIIPPVPGPILGGLNGSVIYQIESDENPNTNTTVERLMEYRLVDGTTRQLSPEVYSGFSDLEIYETYTSNTDRYIAYRFGSHPGTGHLWVADRNDGSFHQVTLDYLANTIQGPAALFSPDDQTLYYRGFYEDKQLFSVDLAVPNPSPVMHFEGANEIPELFLSNGNFLNMTQDPSNSNNRWLALTDAATREQRPVIYTGPYYETLDVSPDESFALLDDGSALHYVPLNTPTPEPINLTQGLADTLPGSDRSNPDVYQSWLGPKGESVYFMGSVDGGWNHHLYDIDLSNGVASQLSNNIPAGGDMREGALAFYDAKDPTDARYYFTSSYSDLDILFEGNPNSIEDPTQVATLFQYSSSSRPHNTILEVLPGGDALLAIKRDYKEVMSVDLETGETFIHRGLTSSNFVIDAERRLIFKSMFLLGEEGFEAAVVVQPLDGSSDPIPLLFNDVARQAFTLSGDLENGLLFVQDASNYDLQGHRTYILDITRTYLKGDLNGDYLVTNDDISAFVMALTDQQAFENTYHNVDPGFIGDFNDDGVMDNLDILGFINLLSGGNEQQAQSIATSITDEIAGVPEPTTLVLLGLGGLMLLRRRA
ncbi:MAG: PEP-CTERM sorting domain-containing protein [Planctomycetota bacterium]